MSNTLTNHNNRNSGLELLKIIAILLIVINHTIQTLSSPNEFVTFNDYVFNISHVSASWDVIILAILRHSGALGNSIFFICSAWFLLDSK